jgi:transposase
MQKAEFVLTDEQWEKINNCLPSIDRGQGGPKPVGNRHCFEGMLWVLRYRARWHDLPKEYTSASTCWRRLQHWEQTEVLENAWRTFLKTLERDALLDWQQVFFKPIVVDDNKQKNDQHMQPVGNDKENDTRAKKQSKIAITATDNAEKANLVETHEEKEEYGLTLEKPVAARNRDEWWYSIAKVFVEELELISKVTPEPLALAGN